VQFITIYGTFQTPLPFGTGVTPQAVAVADVNGDGLPDLVVANSSTNDVSVLLGNGDGTFTGQRRFAAGTSPVAVAVADVNGDGHPDAITVNRSGTVSVLLGNGDGTFQAPQSFATGGSGAASLAVVVADVNGDRRPDLVVANTSAGFNTVSVLLGKGDGTFQAPQSFATGGSIGIFPGSQVLAVKDVNGDGQLDLVVANNGTNDVSVLLGKGDGTFQAPQQFATGSSPQAVAVADVNGDGRLDLITANSGFSGTSASTVSVLLGNGDGTFQAPQSFATTGKSPVAVAVADVNNDGLPDLITANGNVTFGFSTNDVSVLLHR
jgi:hypothetical protein